MANETNESGLPVNSGIPENTGMASTSELSNQNNSSSAQNYQDNAWIGGVKKESRQKGYNEGYQKAIDDMKQKASSYEDPIEKTSPSHSVSTPNASQPQFNPDEIATKAAYLAEHRAKQEHYTQIGARAYAKYGDDYVKKMEEYNQLAQEMSSKQKNDDMANAILLAADIGNEDLVYKLASDENFRNDLLSVNPRLWGKKLLNHQVNASPTAKQMASTRVNGKPNENMPNSASYGDFKERSWEERRRRIRQKSY